MYVCMYVFRYELVSHNSYNIHHVTIQNFSFSD